jgi:hypothetical protein
MHEQIKKFQASIPFKSYPKLGYNASNNGQGMDPQDNVDVIFL